MEVIIRPDRMQAANLAARLIARQIRNKAASVLGLATGRTMEFVYAELVRMHRDEGLDFSLVRTFNLDEYVGLSPGDSHSYRYYMREKLFSLVNIDVRNTHLPLGTAEDLAAECRRYEDLITEYGGVDLQLLGLGASGHIGFNEPLSALRSRTREKALTPATIDQNAPLFPSPDAMPRRGITMGVGTILDSRECVLLVTGDSKAAVLARAVEGPVTAMISASALQLHPCCRVIVDEDAAAELTQKDYYRWVFENEPEWRDYR
jgi:glucosamine-6-phosphate deaminase